MPAARRKAFLRTLFAGKEYVAVRGRDPATLVLREQGVKRGEGSLHRVVEAMHFANPGISSPNI